jgi:hypothetical protein
MAEISVDFLLGPGCTSRAIAWDGLGFGGYSHSAGLLSSGRYLDARSEAMHGIWTVGPEARKLGVVPAGVHIRDPSWEKSIRRTRATLIVTQTEYDDWEANLRAKIGTPYARVDIIGFITGRKVEVNGMWDCSQLQINALQHIKRIPFPLSVPAHQISPNTLKLMMESIDAKLTDVQASYPLVA